jgi:hypothetical protein
MNRRRSAREATGGAFPRIEVNAMDVNQYALEVLVRERLDDARAAAMRRALASRRVRRGLRLRLGAALIEAGRWLAGEADVPAPAPVLGLHGKR